MFLRRTAADFLTKPVGAAPLASTGACILSVLVLLAAACATSSGSRNSFRIATHAPSTRLLTILDGVLQGRANADGSACLWIRDTGGRTALVWPTGFSAGGNPISVYSGTGVTIGEVGKPLRLGGGLVVSNKEAVALGCPDLNQSALAGPLVPGTEAQPALTGFNDREISAMQQIVDSYRDVFGGLWGDPTSHVVTISVAGGADATRTAAARAAIAAVPSEPDAQLGTWRVGYITAGPSLAQLDGVQANVLSAQPWKSIVGRHMVSWGIAPEHHAVIVGVDQITPAISAEALREFDDNVILETTSDLPHNVSQ